VIDKGNLECRQTNSAVNGIKDLTSLGVLHLSSEILNNLRLNAIRYQKKYDDGHVFGHIDQIPSMIEW
jgi:hypothetical protein